MISIRRKFVYRNKIREKNRLTPGLFLTPFFIKKNPGNFLNINFNQMPFAFI